MQQIEELKQIVNECLLLAYEINDILDERNSEALNKLGKIITDLELGVEIL